MKLRLPVPKPVARKTSSFDADAAPLPQGQLCPTPHPVAHYALGRRQADDPQAGLLLLHDQLRFHFGVREAPLTNPTSVRGRWFGVEPSNDAALGSRQWRFYLYQPCARCGELKPAQQFSLWRPGSRDYGLAATDNIARRAWRYRCQIARRRKQSRALLEEWLQQTPAPCADCAKS